MLGQQIIFVTRCGRFARRSIAVSPDLRRIPYATVKYVGAVDRMDLCCMCEQSA